MTTNIIIPTLGESISEGVIATWLKDSGEYVERDEPVLELETDKITMEVPAPASGVVQPAAGVGDTVAVGAVVGAIDETAQKGSEKVTTASSASANDAHATASTVQPSAPSQHNSTGSDESDVRSTPLAKKLAAEKGIDLTLVHGAGASGRIREQDVQTYIESHASDGAAPTAPAAASAPPAAASTSSTSSTGSTSRGVRRERMSPLRQRVAQRLVEAQHTAAMLTTFNECDMTNVMEIRKRFKESFEKKHGVRLGFMSFFISACVDALRTFPRVNSYIAQGADGPEIEVHDYCDIAIAVGTKKGLVVPVLRNCESRSFAEIELGINELAARARDGKLSLEDMQGGTFTISNGGVYGSMMSTPILNPPQSGILGMHNIIRRPVENPDSPGSGEIVVRPMMYLALSYDHRMVDGGEAVGFLKCIKERIEDPQRLLLDV